MNLILLFTVAFSLLGWIIAIFLIYYHFSRPLRLSLNKYIRSQWKLYKKKRYLANKTGQDHKKKTSFKPQITTLENPSTTPHSSGKDPVKSLPNNIQPWLRRLNPKTAQSIISKSRLPFHVAVLNLNGNLNIGAILRTCTVYSCAGYHILGKKRFDPRASVGTRLLTPIHFIDTIFPKLRNRFDQSTVEDMNIDIYKKWLKDFKLVPICIEQGGNTLVSNISMKAVLAKIPHGKTPVFIFGNETWGIPSIMRKHAVGERGGCILSIPQHGPTISLNVSAAASIIVYEYYKTLFQANLKRV